MSSQVGLYFFSVDWTSLSSISQNVTSGSTVSTDPEIHLVRGGIAIPYQHQYIHVFRNNEYYNSSGGSYQPLAVPGRNGDLLIDNKRNPNTRIVYDVVISELPNPYTFEMVFKNIMSALNKVHGYAILSESSSSGHYWFKACFHPEFTTPKVSRDKKIGKFQLVFDRTPEKYANRSIIRTTARSDGTYVNSISSAAGLGAKPMLQVIGNGTTTVSIGDNSITITDTENVNIVVDFENEEVYSTTGANYNSKTTIVGSEFPKLYGAYYTINITGIKPSSVVQMIWRYFDL